ncbi:hypothetical protein [Streptomyces panaciradicis]|uniref:hypothetical protein n=1 Tax=Streptomyces panaciradicis TaxID=1470261 RepID=UPI00201CC6E1|nr:hypothetical protein [Streptomyces panaciradicis]MCL6670150.1 hypothetical protein [Streptomyces panaciradicis]
MVEVPAPGTIRDADTIVVLGHGTIVKRGNHHELLRRPGHYAGLVGRQLESGETRRLNRHPVNKH